MPPPAVVFRMMTRCADALQYVPHLRVCRAARPAPPTTAGMLIEHEIDFGWYAPRIRYVFRADLVADRSIDFRQVSGDFKANEGIWEFEPGGIRRHTLLRYRGLHRPARLTSPTGWPAPPSSAKCRRC